MNDKTIAARNEDEFNALADGFIERGEDQVTLQIFLQVMDDVAERRSQREVELSGRGVNGEIIFAQPLRCPSAQIRFTWATPRSSVENAPA